MSISRINVTEAGVTQAAGASLAWALLEAAKPRITLAVVIASAVGFYVGWAGAFGGDAVSRMGILAVGVLLVVAGANAANQAMEHRHDARMSRTANRPIPSGRLTVGQTLGFAFGASVFGLVILWFGVHPVSAATALSSLLVYLFAYTPLKRRTPWSVWVGAIPGALPPLIGWAGATGGLSAAGWTLFAIMFFWQAPHFMAIAWIYREDYAAAGYPVVPVVEPTGRKMVWQMVLWSLVLIPVSLLPTWAGVAGHIYYVGAAVLGFVYLAFAFEVGRLRTEHSARQHLYASLAYLTVLFSLMVFDKAGGVG